MRGSSIFEVLLVFFGWRFGMYVLFYYWPVNTLGLTQFAVPLLIIAFARRNWADYGFTARDWPNSTAIGLNAYLLQLLPVGTMLLLSWFGLNIRDLVGGALIGTCQVVTLLILLGIIQRRERGMGTRHAAPTGAQGNSSSSHEGGEPTLTSIQPRRSPGRSDLITIAVLLAFPIILAIALRLPTQRIGDVIFWDLWQFCVSGFGEEALYRGYIQSRVNSEFGRPYEFKGVKFGLGVFVAAALFGLTHVLNPFDPLRGNFTLLWGWGIMAFGGGLFFGFIREKTGDIIGCGIAHGLPDAVGESIYLIMTGHYA